MYFYRMNERNSEDRRADAIKAGYAAIFAQRKAAEYCKAYVPNYAVWDYIKQRDAAEYAISIEKECGHLASAVRAALHTPDYDPDIKNTISECLVSLHRHSTTNDDTEQLNPTERLSIIHASIKHALEAQHIRQSDFAPTSDPFFDPKDNLARCAFLEWLAAELNVCFKANASPSRTP
jgi:hypothetical protein